MASPAQILANQANAQKSTGPRTEAGRKRSALNALDHGLTAATFESFTSQWRTEFEPFFESLSENYSPANEFEQTALHEYAVILFMSVKSRSNEVKATQSWIDNPDDPEALQHYKTTLRYVHNLARRAKAAKKDLETLILNRELAQDLEARAQEEFGYTISIPPGRPLATLYAMPQLNLDPSKLALRIVQAFQQGEIRAEAEKVQNEPNLEDTPTEK